MSNPAWKIFGRFVGELLTVLVLFGTASIGFAQGESAVQAPSAADRARLENPKTPTETAAALGISVNSEKPDRIAKFLWAADDTDGKLARAVADRIVASMELRKALAETFPQSNLDMRPFGVVEPGDFYSIVAGEWKENGDKAIIGNHEGNQPSAGAVTMRKINGGWKLDITPRNESVADAMVAVKKHTGEVNNVASAILSHRLKDAEAVKAALAKADMTGVIPPEPVWPAIVPGRKE